MCERLRKNLFAILGRCGKKVRTPSTRKTAYKRMRHTELGTDSSERVLKVKTPSFMAQAWKFIAGGQPIHRLYKTGFIMGLIRFFKASS